MAAYIGKVDKGGRVARGLKPSRGGRRYLKRYVPETEYVSHAVSQPLMVGIEHEDAGEFREDLHGALAV